MRKGSKEAMVEVIADLEPVAKDWNRERRWREFDGRFENGEKGVKKKRKQREGD